MAICGNDIDGEEVLEVRPGALPEAAVGRFPEAWQASSWTQARCTGNDGKCHQRQALIGLR